MARAPLSTSFESFHALMADPSTLTPIDQTGGIRMNDVSQQANTVRTAVATGRVLLGAEAFQRIRNDDIRKGDVLTTAQVSGIMGAKQTSQLLPLCHDVQMGDVEIEFNFDEDAHAVDIRAYTKSVGITGVQMEAMTAVSIAALTIYDMCKSVTKEMRITDVHLLAKTGGQSGNWKTDETAFSSSDDE
jgi:molybdenum cofactor biosynthesis protein MoaC